MCVNLQENGQNMPKLCILYAKKYFNAVAGGADKYEL